MLGDRTRLTQVVSNLLNNAAKFTPNDGRIELTLKPTDGQAALRVQDSGIGLGRRIRRASRALCAGGTVSRSIGGGLGIGLTLARRLVELHGGQIEASSDGPGQGSVCVLRLPVWSSPDAPATPRSSPASAAPSASRRVLVVDDHPDSLLSLTELLRAVGHVVEMAADGPSALEQVRKFRPDVMLLDLGLPHMNGYEVARHVRSQLGGDLVLIALSGYGRDEDRQKTREAGFTHHLVKPADVGLLLRLIAGEPRPGTPAASHAPS